MSRRAAFMAIIGGMLIPTPCYAHSVHPIFWWLGPAAPMMTIGSVIGCVPLLAIVACQALLLHRFIPGGGFPGSLWRATVIFVLSKVAESLPVFINPDVGLRPRSDPDAVFTTIVVLMPVAAVVAISLLIGLFYWRRRPRLLRIVWLSLALEFVSCGGLYLTNNALAYLRII